MINFNKDKFQKGQAFESFRLLIAFILTTAILAIIYSMVRSTNEQSILISNDKLKEAAVSASKAPGTSAQNKFVVEDLQLKGLITKADISNKTNLAKECLFFKNGSGIKKLDNGDIKIENRALKMDVYIYCNFKGQGIYTNSDYYSELENCDNIGNADRYCIFFFNTKPPEGTYETASN
ncbi:MAG: hypothetical protein V1824_00055 [archaeon]